MKKPTRWLALILVLVTIVSVCAVPVAALSYPMAVTITYKSTDGTILGGKSFEVDAAAEYRTTLKVTSPSYAGYSLKDSSDTVVTGDMISWYFPPSHYVRHGTGSYTVYYVKDVSISIRYLYGSTRRTAATSKEITGAPSASYTTYPKYILGYSASVSSISSTYGAGDQAFYYYIWTYTLSFDANGGTGAPSAITYNYGQSIGIPSTYPRRTGYDFVGWGTGKYSTSPSYTPDDQYSESYSRTLYAVWKAKTYTLSYDANGGSGAPASQTKTYGETINIPTTIPTRSGYTFMGWGTVKTATYVAFSPGEEYSINYGRTLYAVWEKNPEPVTYTVSYNANGGTGAPSSQTKTQNITLTLSNIKPTRSGYTFKGWSTSSSAVAATYSAGGSYYTNSSATLYAVWELIPPTTYTVSYNANGGSGAPSSQTKTQNVALTLSYFEPTRSGYTFLGWSKSSSATSATYYPGSSYTSNASVTLYAVWQKVVVVPSTYTVSYSANGGSGAPSSQTKTQNVTLTLSSTRPIRTNYTFMGWSTSTYATSATYQPGGSYTANSSATLYAVWTYTPATYTVSYNANGGSGAPSSQTKTYNVDLQLSSAVPYRSGYTFEGWATSSTATIASYTPSEYYVANSAITLYAVWDKIPPATYIVSYNANGGTGAPGNQTKTHDVTLTLSSVKPSRDGYSFLGWATYSTATNASYQAGSNYTANSTVTLYAVWKTNTYTVSYSANGGSNAPSSQTKTHGTTLVLSSVIPTKDNNAFLGWATSQTATSAEFQPGDGYTDDETVTLYAVWQERNYDFSASDLATTPEEVEQYGKVTVSLRLDSWDKNLSYSNIPVEVLLNGNSVYSSTVDFTAYGVQNIVFNLNVGASEGTQTLTARVNWSDHSNETRTGNNETTTTFSVKKVIETSTTAVTVNGSYVEGCEVISSFYAINDGSSDILPSDNLSFDFLVYTLENGSIKTVSQQTWNNVVIPANGTNLVYFKWTVPSDSAGTTYYCKGTINNAKADKEQDKDNNSTEYAIVAQSFVTSQTENTRYEANAPVGYNASVTSPGTKSGTATWNMWVYENNSLVLKSYGITVTNSNPNVAPGSGCVTAEKNGSSWKMKSGYGITLSWMPTIVMKSGYTMPGADAYTSAQCVFATFPEFSYSTAAGKYRTLESVGGVYQFIENTDADKNERVHFIPVYVQNGNYTVSVTASQIWTPAGMITATRNANALNISGTVYDDYYQG